MTFTEQLITISVVILGTMITRFLPFLVFSTPEKTPGLIVFLGKTLPSAVMGMLVVYSFKDVDIFSRFHGMPEFLAALFTIGLQLLLKNLLLTIGGGTIFYMLLVQYAFK